MPHDTAQLDLRGLPPGRQVELLKEQYEALRGTGSIVRARVEEPPTRPYISLLERGFRVVLERDDEGTSLILNPDGSTPRLGVRGAHSVAFHPAGKVYANTTGDRKRMRSKSHKISPSRRGIMMNRS